MDDTVQPNDLRPQDWLVLCRRIYRELRKDNPDDALELLEESGFSLDDAEADDEPLMTS